MASSLVSRSMIPQQSPRAWSAPAHFVSERFFLLSSSRRIVDMSVACSNQDVMQEPKVEVDTCGNTPVEKKSILLWENNSRAALAACSVGRLSLGLARRDGQGWLCRAGRVTLGVEPASYCQRVPTGRMSPGLVPRIAIARGNGRDDGNLTVWLCLSAC